MLYGLGAGCERKRMCLRKLVRPVVGVLKMKPNQGAARRQVSDVVAERIERLIVDGVLKVGQPLPSERRLCEKLGISRSALREGLKVLRGRGIIETAQGRDSRVAKLSGERDASPLMHLFNSQPRTLYDLLEVRGLGLLDIKAIFGETAVRRKMRLKLIVHLVKRGVLDEEVERLPFHFPTEEVLGLPIRKVVIPVAAGRNIAVLLEAAVRNTILQLRGIDTLQEFMERQRQAMSGD